MKRAVLFGLFLGMWAISTSCQENTDTEPLATLTDPGLTQAGGTATVNNATSKAFGQPISTLSDTSLTLHKAGDALFEDVFVPPPSLINPGLGPLFNNNACVSCHTADGRGQPELSNQQFHSILLRLSLPGVAADGGPVPVPGFGLQLQNHAIQGTLAEGDFQVSYVELPGTFADGTTYSLRQPTFRVINPYMALPGDVTLSPRVAPPVFGLGLLEAVDDVTLLSASDENDANGDGISGRVNRVWDETRQQTVIGRFGWKANQPSLLQQAAVAAQQDMGLTSNVFPYESAKGQVQDIPAHEVELSVAQVTALTHYTQTLAVPAARTQSDITVAHGRKLFLQAGCGSCHTQTLHTGTLAGVPEVSNQTIHPYTDMLLHDMGPGLADGRRDYLATGAEWRTAPLWGIGLTLLVNGHSNFLHDGRARNFVEAILWHGGEAQKARDTFKNLSQADRAAVLAFLNSL